MLQPRRTEPVPRRRDWLDLALILSGVLLVVAAGAVFLLFALYLLIG